MLTKEYKGGGGGKSFEIGYVRKSKRHPENAIIKWLIMCLFVNNSSYAE